MFTFPKLRRAPKLETSRQQRAKRTVRPTFEGLEKREVMTVAFNPALGPEVVYWRSNAGGAPANSVVNGPVANPTALQNPTVYLIFSGKSWTTANASWESYLAQRIMNSSYLSGLTQYGASGTANFGGYIIDNSPSQGPAGTNAEIAKALGWLEPSWKTPTTVAPNPGGSNAGNPGYQQSPIYVVIDDNGPNNTASNAAGVVNIWGIPFLTNEITINSGVSADNFTEQFSRELVDRIVEGTGNGLAMNASQDVSGHAYNADIADNEPEAGRYVYNEDGLERVQAYWSVVDQKFIIPDGNQQTVTLDPIWNGHTFTNQFDALAIQNSTGVGAPTTEPTSAAKNYIQLGDEVFVFANTSIRNIQVDALVSSWTGGRVWEYSGPGTAWTPITSANLNATQLVTNGLYVFVRANNTVLEDWHGATATLTGGNTNVSEIAVNGANVFMLANNNGGHTYVWKYDYYTGNWNTITGAITNVSDIESSNDGLFMLANNGGSNLVWQYTGNGVNWTPESPYYWNVSQIVSTGSSLYMMTNDKNVGQVWDYVGGTQTWNPITGAATSVTQIIGAGDKLYMLGTNNPVWGDQVWKYEGFGTYWTQITPIGQYVTSLVSRGDALFIVIDFGLQLFQYTGKNSNWVQVW